MTGMEEEVEGVKAGPGQRVLPSRVAVLVGPAAVPAGRKAVEGVQEIPHLMVLPKMDYPTPTLAENYLVWSLIQEFKTIQF